MSKSRGYLTRPRTKVYDCNYDIGQQYYKSAIDNLDRKYSGKAASVEPVPATNGTLSSLRASLERERKEPSPLVIPKRRPVVEFDDEEYTPEPRKSGKSATLLGEFDSIFENRARLNIREEKKSKISRALEDEIDEGLSSSMQRIRASRARAAEETDVEISRPSRRSKLELSDSLLSRGEDSSSSSRVVAKRQVVKITTSSDSSALKGDESMTKWTALKDDRRRHALDEEPDSAVSLAAAARAKKSLARLEDLENEIQELTDRNQAREKRIRDLRSFMQENDVSTENVQSVKVKSSVRSEKKIISH